MLGILHNTDTKNLLLRPNLVLENSPNEPLASPKECIFGSEEFVYFEA